MGADQTPDPTALSDDQLDSFLDALAQRAAERDDLQLVDDEHGSGGVLDRVSRRNVLKTAGAAVAGGLIGKNAKAAGENFNDASGTVGTDAKPLDDINSASADIRDVDTASADFAGDPVYDVTHSKYGAAGDGTTDDTSAIQSAINDAANDGGGVVFIPAGHFYIPSGLEMATDVTLKGIGYNSRLDVPDTNSDGIYVVDTDRVTVASLRLTGNPSASNKQTAVAGKNTDDLTVRHCWIEGWAGDASNTLDNSKRTVYAFNRVENCGDDGLNPGGGTAGTRNNPNNLVVGNVVRNCTNDGIHISFSAGATAVVGNTLTGNGAAIGLASCFDTTVVGNACQKNTQGVSIGSNASGSPKNLTIGFNTFYDTDDYCVYVNSSDTVIQTSIIGNSFLDLNKQAMRIGVCRDLTVAYNQIEYDASSPSSAILIFNGNDVNISNNRIKNANTAIRVLGPISVSIDNNIIQNANRFGIEYDSGVSGGETVNSSVCGNRIDGVTDFDGILLRDVINVACNDNIVFDDGRAPIRADNDSDYILADGNLTGAGLNIGGSNSVTGTNLIGK